MFDAKLANLTSAIHQARGGGKTAPAEPTRPDMIDPTGPYMGSHVQDAAPATPQTAAIRDHGIQQFWSQPDTHGNGVGLVGKALGTIPGAPFLDAEGRRGAQSWGDAAKNTASFFTPGGAYHTLIDPLVHSFNWANESAKGQHPIDWSDPASVGEQSAEGLGFGMGALTVGSMIPKRMLAPDGPPLFANAGDSKAAALGNALARSSDVDHLGYYSQLDRVLGSLNPKDSVTLDTLAKRGVKAAELEARGLLPDLQAGAVRVSDLQAKAGERVGLTQVKYGGDRTSLRADGLTPDARKQYELFQHSGIGETLDDLRGFISETADYYKNNSEPIPRGLKELNQAIRSGQIRMAQDDAIAREVADIAKYKPHSLDPSNPTYRETVLHLPGTGKNDFQSGHFPEPNIVGHMMTSINEVPGGGRAFTLDQIQSDWAQTLTKSNGERKINKLQAKIDGMTEGIQKWTQENEASGYNLPMPDSLSLYDLVNLKKELAAEKSKANANRGTAHPLVKSTDQWTNTTLRRAVQQAVDADADHIAVPSGKDVINYNAGGGDTHGMTEFYDKIVPKNLQNILVKLDPTTQSQVIKQLVTPSGPKGTGFTVFPLSDTAKANARKGMPLFANAGGNPLLMNALAQSAHSSPPPSNSLARSP